jgi:hypothetical protein
MTGKSEKKRLLSSEEITVALAEVAALAKASGRKAVLVGGVALHQYGSDRLTADIDIAVDGPIDALPIESPISFGGYQSHTPSGVPVDLIVRDDDYAAVFDEALEYGRDLPGVPIRVASPEQLVLMKMIARRRKDELDLDALLESGQVDVPKARRLVKRLLGVFALDEFNEILQVAEWRRSTHRS